MKFTKEIVDLYEQIKETEESDEKIEMMLELAELFVSQTEDTDTSLDEDMHDLIQNVISSRMYADRAAMLLARVILRHMPSYVLEHSSVDDTDDDISNVN